MQDSTLQLFELIVKTLQSPLPVEPGIIRHHISEYAKKNYISYDLARQAVIEAVRIRIENKLASI